jgi:hypothetical protein
MSNQETTPFPDTITLTDGVTLTTNWRNYISNLDPNPNYIRAFNIPMADINSLSQFVHCPSVRVYLSMTVPGDVSSLKVILVPVDENNKDITSILSATEGGVEASTIFDFTTPCPKTCDIDSPLF